MSRGFLSRLPDVEAILDATDPETPPDYLTADPVGIHQHRTEHAFIPPSGDPDTLLGVANAIRNRRVSPVELVEQALQRIAERDPALNAFHVVLADHARAAAQRAEDDLIHGRYRGPLHGVPVAVKELFDFAGVPTSAGSKIRANAIAATHSTVVERLETAGAVIVGKTRMSEFAYSPGSNNAHYGPTANPWNRERDSGGSSSGSAVAVATGMVYAAIGSDTGGSIRIPAALCGIVGLKPTFGRVSLGGAVTLSWSLDHAGPLTREVGDAAAVLAAIAGIDPRDPRTTRFAPPALAGDFSAGVHGMRVGLLSADGSNNPLGDAETIAALQTAGDALRAAGAAVDLVAIPEIDKLRWLNGAILAMEAASMHINTLRHHLDDLGEFMRHRILAAFAYPASAMVRAQQARRELRARCLNYFSNHDILCLPNQPAPAPALGIPAPTSFTGPFNCLGWPAIHVPTGLSQEGMPLGVQLVAMPWAEPLLFQAAMALERELGRVITGLDR